VLDDQPEPKGAALAERSAAAPILTGEARERALESLRGVRRGKLGTIEARISNVAAVLGVPEISGHELALDEFQDVIMTSDKGGEWRQFVDTDYTHLRVWLETAGNCDPISHEMMRHSVQLVAERNKFDTAQLWLENLKWDGKPRVERFCPAYFGTLDTPYERSVSRYIWSTLAGRVMAPGCQADMVPVLIGKQGVGKSRGVQAMVPSAEHYVELRLDEPDDAIARKMRGVLVAEFAEMRGLRAADVERTKAFITRTHEKLVPKYREFATNYPRRFLIIGTTNDEEFLPPDTEHRRWLPLHTDVVNVGAIQYDRDQLWAEGLHYWREHGIAWQGLDVLAKPAREAASVNDNWQEQIAAWIDENPADYYRMTDVLTNAVGIDARTVNRSHELRVGRVLHALGYVRKSKREPSGRVIKAWFFDPTA
jgi:predicted P-loop ATPase